MSGKFRSLPKRNDPSIPHGFEVAEACKNRVVHNPWCLDHGLWTEPGNLDPEGHVEVLVVLTETVGELNLHSETVL